MSNTSQIPALTMTIQGFAPTVIAADGNRVNLRRAKATASGLEPTIQAGQQKLRYGGRLGVRTRLGTTLE